MTGLAIEDVAKRWPEADIATRAGRVCGRAPAARDNECGLLAHARFPAWLARCRRAGPPEPVRPEALAVFVPQLGQEGEEGGPQLLELSRADELSPVLLHAVGGCVRDRRDRGSSLG